MIRFLLPIFLLIQLVYGDESSAMLLFEKGNQAYQAGDYSRAADLYKQALSENYISDELYFNLGNACFKMNKIGWAILYYNKALLLNPSDKDIKFNLKIASLRKTDRVEVPDQSALISIYYAIRDYMNATVWGTIFSFFLLTGALSFSLRLFIDREFWKKVLSSILAVSLISALIISPFFINRLGFEKSADRGIILESEVKVMGAPYDAATELFILHEGTEVKIIKKNDEWINVELIDGKQGWIRQSSMGVI